MLATENQNIADLLNKSRGDIAYTLIDVDSDISNDIVEALAGNRWRTAGPRIRADLEPSTGTKVM